jgi:hypothetical protein
MYVELHRCLHVVGPAHYFKRTRYIHQQEAWRNDDIDLDLPHLPVTLNFISREYPETRPALKRRVAVVYRRLPYALLVSRLLVAEVGPDGTIPSGTSSSVRNNQAVKAHHPWSEFDSLEAGRL